MVGVLPLSGSGLVGSKTSPAYSSNPLVLPVVVFDGSASAAADAAAVDDDMLRIALVRHSRFLRLRAMAAEEALTAAAVVADVAALSTAVALSPVRLSTPAPGPLLACSAAKTSSVGAAVAWRSAI